MLTDGIKLRNFKKKNKNFIVLRNLNLIVNDKNQLISSLSKNYKDSFNKQLLKKYKKFSNFRIIGMGGSILGTQAIYNGGAFLYNTGNNGVNTVIAVVNAAWNAWF